MKISKEQFHEAAERLRKLDFANPSRIIERGKVDLPEYSNIIKKEAMNTFIEDAIFETSEKLRVQKEALIIERLGNYMRGGDKIDLVKESQRLFPRLKCVYRAEDKGEHWYWNNGMENGYHLISFFPDDPKPFDKDNPNRFVIGFKYI